MGELVVENLMFVITALVLLAGLVIAICIFIEGGDKGKSLKEFCTSTRNNKRSRNVADTVEIAQGIQNLDERIG